MLQVISLISTPATRDTVLSRRSARKACWLAYCKVRPDVVGHPDIFGIQHLTYYVLGHTKYFSGILNNVTLLFCDKLDQKIQTIKK